AQTAGVALRVRLFIDTKAARLQGLKWELLRVPWADDPDPGRPLSMRQQVLFSRYLSSFDWRPAQLRPKDELRALIAVANPSNLVEYRMAPIDVDGEVARARDYLEGAAPPGDDTQPAVPRTRPIPCRVIRGHATLNQVVSGLQRDDYDILYLVCHGALIRGEARLYLEGPDGKVAATPGGEVVARLADLPSRPRLVVLGSCQSAGKG